MRVSYTKKTKCKSLSKNAELCTTKTYVYCGYQYGIAGGGGGGSYVMPGFVVSSGGTGANKHSYGWAKLWLKIE